jgi:hypothetical protein
MQRVHQQDLVGYLQEQGGFEVLNLPSIAQRSCSYPTGPQSNYFRMAGEILHPQHESAAVLLDLKRSMGSMSFSAQYQQTPVPIGGTFIKSKWLKSHANITFEPEDRIVLSWDIALSEAQTGDYSAGVALLNRGETFYVLEVVRGRFPFPQLIEKIMEMCRRFPQGALLIEVLRSAKGIFSQLRTTTSMSSLSRRTKTNCRALFPKAIYSKEAQYLYRRGLNGAMVF